MDAQALRVAMDTMWVLITAFLVFFMNLGFAMVESGLCRAKNTVNILAKNFIVFAVSSLALLRARLRDDVRRRQRARRPAGSARPLGRRQQPGHWRRLPGRLRGPHLDGRAAVGEVLLPARLRRHGRDDRLGRGGRAHQVPVLHRLLRARLRGALPGDRPLDLGRRLARVARHARLRRLDGGALRRRLGGAGRRHGARPAHRASTARTDRPVPCPATT